MNKKLNDTFIEGIIKKFREQFIGCEISSEYCDIIKERVGCEIITN